MRRQASTGGGVCFLGGGAPIARAVTRCGEHCACMHGVCLMAAYIVVTPCWWCAVTNRRGSTGVVYVVCVCVWGGGAAAKSGDQG